MVAMTPLITIQIMGLIFAIKEHKHQAIAVAPTTLADYGDMEIIEL